MDTALSLYLHIPFCKHRCSYCDFNTYTSLAGLQDAYVTALCQEVIQVGTLAEAAAQRRPVDTVFFGGGTPSLLSPTAIGQILQTVRRSFAFTSNAEITMEANPGTVDEAYLAAVLAAGINRISFGVQSSITTELALLGREHDFATVVKAVEMARATGFDNINLDLIYGVPTQTIESWQQSVETALMLQPEHLSLYCLTIEPGTPMQRWLKNGQIQPPDPDLAADQYEMACDIMRKEGFIHYEISNWALPGRQCRHNLTYWRNEEYLGLGAGAHGYAAGYRYHVVKQPRVYIRRIEDDKATVFPLSAAVAGKHKLDRAEAMADTIITQLRLLEEGLDLTSFEVKFGITLDEAYNGTVSQLMEWELLRMEGSRLLLTEKGRFLSNQVFYRFM